MKLKNKTYGSIKGSTYSSLKDLPYGIDLGDPVQYNASIISRVIQAYSGSFQLINNVIPDNLVAVTSASGSANPLLPTLVANGQIIYSNPATVPAASAIVPNECYVNLTCSNLIGLLDADDLNNWTINLDELGGTWSCDSFTDLPTYGVPVTVFGLHGTITRKGDKYAAGAAPYKNGGIFGARGLNRELAFLVYGNIYYSFNNVNQYLQKPNNFNIKSHADAARLIASLAGIEVAWTIPDYPLTTWQPQASQTAGQALSSLASESGGVLRWNGNNSYLITFPDRSTGLWEVPECCLVVDAEQECNLDLNSGLYNPGTYLVPQLGTFDSGSLSIINIINGSESNVSNSSPTTNNLLTAALFQSQPKSPPEQIRSFTTLLTQANDFGIDLPFDTDVIYIKNVFKTSPEGVIGATIDPTQWAILQVGITGGSVRWNDINGKLRPQLIVDPAWFPSESNADVATGEGAWYMNIGVTRKVTPVTNVDTATGQSLARTLMKYRFIPFCTGTITCAFFGSIPTPGMSVSAFYNGKTFTGIIESVNFSSPGTITVQYVKWGRLEFYSQLGNGSNLGFIT